MAIATTTITETAKHVNSSLDMCFAYYRMQAIDIRRRYKNALKDEQHYLGYSHNHRQEGGFFFAIKKAPQLRS